MSNYNRRQLQKAKGEIPPGLRRPPPTPTHLPEPPPLPEDADLFIDFPLGLLETLASAVNEHFTLWLRRTPFLAFSALIEMPFLYN